MDTEHVGNSPSKGALEGSGSNAIHPGQVDRAGIHRLPNELLVEVFLHNSPVAPNWWGCYDIPPKFSSVMSDVVAITHVCRLWRSIALRLPGLWRYITCGTLNHMETAISRAGPRGVVLDLGSEEPLTDDALRRISDMIQRALPLLESLSFVGHSAELWILNHVSKERDCRKLTSLRFGYADPQTVWEDLDHCDINAPNLRTLHMNGCFIPWTSPIYHAPLTQLSIPYLLPLETTFNDAMLTAIGNLPTLECLAINHGPGRITKATNDLFDASVVSSHKYAMPKLEYMHFSGTLRDCACFLSCFVVPTDALVCLNAEFVGPNEGPDQWLGGAEQWTGDVEHLIAVVAKHFEQRSAMAHADERGQFPRIVGLCPIDDSGFRLDLNRWGLEELCGRTFPLQGLHQKDKFGSLFSIELCVPPAACRTFGPLLLPKCQDVVRDICSVMPVADVDTFRVGHGGDLQLDWRWWMQMSGRLPHVNTIVVDDFSGDLLPFMLLLRRVGLVGNIICPLVPGLPDFFPNLKNLVVASDSVFCQPACESAIYDALLQGLCWRQAHGQESGLKVISNRVVPYQLAKLQKFVTGQVEWVQDVARS